jgi:hypothetical protein
LGLAATACSVGGDPTTPPAPPPIFIGASLVSCAAPSSDIVAPDSHHAADLAVLDAIAPASAGVRPIKSGAWSDPSVWNGSAPTGGRIVIPKGVGIIIDAPLAPAFASVRVDGCLEFARDRDTRLRTDLLYVAPGGELWVGSASAPIAPSVKAEISFPSVGPIDVAKDKSLIGKGLVSASKTTIVGAAKSSRLKAATPPLDGATTIALESAPVGWRVGDRVVLTGTRWVKFFDVGGIRRAQGAQDEELTITAINGASVTVSPALKYDHDGPGAAFRAYLVNFTRNVRLATENAASRKVSERAHALFMSPQTVIRSAEFDEMGRTDKSRRAVAASSLTQVLPDSNVKGRYPLHLHKTGHGGAGADIRNIAVWKSPGWGVAQHSSPALLYDNAVYRAFGAGFVAEAGDEQGAWVSNIAIQSEGVAEIVKDAQSVAAFDLARTGDGFWLQGRLIHLHGNVAAGMGGGVGFVYMHRGTDIADPEPIHADMVLQPASFRFEDQKIEHANIQQFTDNEVLASRVGFHVVKFGPHQPHDVRSVIDGFTAWEVGVGVDLTYVSRYTVRDAALIGSRLRPSTVGVSLGQNTFDLAVVDSRIEDFDYGVVFDHGWTTNFAAAAFHASANNVFRNIRLKEHSNADAHDIILAGAAPAIAPSLTFGWGASLPAWQGAPNFRSLQVWGQKTDAFGATTYPLSPGEFHFDDAGVKSLLAQHGYYTLPDGRRVAVAPEHYSDRSTGELELASFVFEIDPAFSLANYRHRGVLDLARPAPNAADDSATAARNGSVAIDVLANDGPGGPLAIAGVTLARNGVTTVLADGRIRYAPFPDFAGVDSFSYWARSADGRFAKAKVTVTVR